MLGWSKLNATDNSTFNDITDSKLENTKDSIVKESVTDNEEEEEEEFGIHKALNVEPIYITDDSDLEFTIDLNDVMFTLGRSKSLCNTNFNTFVCKMFVIREKSWKISLKELSKILNGMQVERLAIFSITEYIDNTRVYIAKTEICNLIYTEIHPEEYTKFLNSNVKFLQYNKYSLYILRYVNSGFLDIKNLFASINGCKVNIAKGGTQKNHLLSPMEFRLSIYLMAIFKFDYDYINYLNKFWDINKERYLSYKDVTYRFKSTVKYKSIFTKKEN